MKSSVPTLLAPTMLIAMPQVMDPFFHRTVILLVHHDSEGSLGYIVNRPTEVKVADLCEGLGIVWSGSDEERVHFGGPVQAEVGAVLYGGERVGKSDTTLDIEGELHITANRDDLREISSMPPPAFRLLLGYAGWGPGQIDNEFMRGDWLTADPRPDLVFPRDSSNAWREALESIGVDPGALPILSDDDGSKVN